MLYHPGKLDQMSLEGPTEIVPRPDPGTVHTHPTGYLGENSPTTYLPVTGYAKGVARSAADVLDFAPFRGVLVDERDPNVTTIDAGLPSQNFRVDQVLMRASNARAGVGAELRAIIVWDGSTQPIGLVAIGRIQPDGTLGQKQLAVTQFGPGPETRGNILGVFDEEQPFTLGFSSARTHFPRTISIRGSVATGKMTIDQQGEGAIQVILPDPAKGPSPEAARQLSPGYETNWLPPSDKILHDLGTFSTSVHQSISLK